MSLFRTIVPGLAAGLAEAGIDEVTVTQQLEDEGLAVFIASYDELISGVEEKRDSLSG